MTGASREAGVRAPARGLNVEIVELPDRPRQWGRRVPFAYLLLAVLLLLPAWSDPAGRAAGVAGDPVFFIWILRWVPAAIMHLHDPLISSFQFYPVGINLMWNTSFTFPAALMSPITLGFGPVFAWNTLLTLAFAASAWTAYAATHRITGSGLGAFAAGLLYGFSPYMVGQGYGHVFLVLMVFPPLVLLILHELLVTRAWSPWRCGLALGLLTAAQLLTSLEVLATTALLTIIGLLCLAALRPNGMRDGATRLLKSTAVALVVAVPLCAGPLLVMFTGPQRVRGSVLPPDVFVADLLNFAIPTKLQAAVLGQPFESSAGLVETTAYLGIPLLVLLLVVVLVHRQRSVVRWTTVLLVLTIVLAMGEHLQVAGHVTSVPLPWIALRQLPLLRSALPVRLTAYVILLAGVLLAILVEDIRNRPQGAWRLAGIVGLGAATVALFPALPYPSTPDPVPAYFVGEAVRRIPEGSVALVVPIPNGSQRIPGASSNTALLWQAAAGVRFKMPGGYGFIPDAAGNGTLELPPSALTDLVLGIQAGGPQPALDPAGRQAALGDLRSWRTQTVIVGPMPNQARMISFFKLLLERAPFRQPGDVFVWEGVDATP